MTQPAGNLLWFLMANSQEEVTPMPRIQQLQWIVMKVSWNRSGISFVKMGTGIHMEPPLVTSASVSLAFLSRQSHEAVVPTILFCLPAADPTYCGTPPRVENAVVITPEELYPPNSRVTYQCRLNFHQEGASQGECRNGQWNVNLICARMYDSLSCSVLYRCKFKWLCIPLYIFIFFITIFIVLMPHVIMSSSDINSL